MSVSGAHPHQSGAAGPQANGASPAAAPEAPAPAAARLTSAAQIAPEDISLPAPAPEEIVFEGPLRIGVVAETREHEHRVAATPETVRILIKLGAEVAVQTGAGEDALISDDDYRAAGAVVAGPEVLQHADMVLHVRPLTAEQIALLKPGAITVGFTTGRNQLPGVQALAAKGCTTLAMELIPRISRAQSMDALTSQALISGYRCVIQAALRMPRFFPMFMTAAGTVPPARVLVLGAGVAGLQAIATAKRLGAIVQAYDVRSASADEVRSMGGTFIDLELETADGSGGYARELTDDRARRQQEALAPYVAKSDVLITTALLQGRNAPVLVTREMIEGMGPGSIAIDMAADKGGNIEGSEPGVEHLIGNCRVYGMVNPASGLPVDASRLYAKNITNLLTLGLTDGRFTLNLGDEVIDSACLMAKGMIRNDRTLQAIAALTQPQEA